MTTTQVPDIAPVERPETGTLAATETARFADAVRSLTPDQWARPTDCPAWDVRAMAGHVLGMVQTFSSLRRFASSMRAGTKAAGDGPFIDGLTAVQVEANARLGTAELVRRLDEAGPAQARWRASRRLMRKMPLKQDMPDGSVETWRLAYLVDIILTRDTWMHRIDVSRAVGQAMDLSAEHDGRIGADAVAEWARRHGKPFTLQLTGPAGGTFVQGDGGEELTLDAIDFCRILSNRAEGDGLLAQSVPF